MNYPDNFNSRAFNRTMSTSADVGLQKEEAQVAKAQAAYRHIMMYAACHLRAKGFTQITRDEMVSIGSGLSDALRNAVDSELETLADAEFFRDIEGDEKQAFYDKIYATINLNATKLRPAITNPATQSGMGAAHV